MLFFYKERLTKSAIIDLFNDHDFNLAKVDNENRISDLSNAEIDDLKMKECHYIFDCLQHRKALLNSKYPFIITNNAIEIKNISLKIEKVYLIFLFASSLDIFSDMRSVFTKEFEYLVYLSMLNYFPSHATVKEFGKTSRYTGQAIDKIYSLASDMKLETNDQSIVDDVRGNQEKGLDLVAWTHFQDDFSNKLMYFFQCACGKYWNGKTNEARRYLEYFDFRKLEPIFAIAISYGLNMAGTFERISDITASKSLLLDRIRILEFLNEDCINQDHLESISIVDSLNALDLDL